MKRECPEGRCDGTGNMGEGVRGVCFKCLTRTTTRLAPPYTIYAVALLYQKGLALQLCNVPITVGGVRPLTDQEAVARVLATTDVQFPEHTVMASCVATTVID